MKLQDKLKKRAALKAVDFIKSGMKIGLGTGSTVFYALEEIGKRIKTGELNNIEGIPSSDDTKRLAKKFGIKLTDFSKISRLDINIDGADEVDKKVNLIKGGGGALLREKVVFQCADLNLIIVDESKVSENLGEKWGVPVEVVPFAKDAVTPFIKKFKGSPVLRVDKNMKPAKTDQGNLLYDCKFGIIENPSSLAKKLNTIAGIVEHGIFFPRNCKVIVAENEKIFILEKKKKKET